MKYTFHENLAERNGVISNLHGFFNRNLDSGFKSKWSGFWAPPYKFLDYYAVKLNGIWLKGDSLNAVEYGESMVFHHETDTLEITETVSAPDGVPGFTVELEILNKTESVKAVQTTVENGVDIRRKDEDIGPQNYSIDKGANKLTVMNGDRKLMISSQHSIELEGEPYIKEHYPDQRQLCYIPGQMVMRDELEPNGRTTIQIDYTTSSATFDSVKDISQEFNHDKLGFAYLNAIDSMKNLIYDKNGLGVIAGHPWFQSYWARDTYWTLMGLIDAGYFEAAEKILLNFAERDGFVSRISLDGERDSSNETPRDDTAPLFVIAADKYLRHAGPNEVLEQKIEDAFEQLELEGNVVNSDADGSWMDTLERPIAVDIQALWLEAAERRGREIAEKLRKGLEKFETDRYMRDNLEDGAETINPTVPLMFGQLGEEDADNCLKKINAEFSSRYGARTRSVTDPGYDSNGYHTGSVWGLTTGWAAAANLEYGNSTQGINFLEKLARSSDRTQPGAFPEVMNAETGEITGCTEQAWSAGMYVYVVDSYLLGIEVGADGKVKIDPADGLNCRRDGKRVLGETLDIEVSDGKAKVTNDPDLDLEL